MTSNIRLPSIKRIQIYDILDSNENLVDSFFNWIPNNLKFLFIHHSAPGGIPIKYKLDINSFWKAVAAVLREVFINCFEFSAADLQQFIKASWNVERIVFYFCSVHCSSTLDFETTIKYNTNFLGFDYWGDTDYKDLSTDWISDPSCFSHIVDAIGSSGLRDSLTKISISYNQTLKWQEVQELFNVNGMSHISVVEEYSNPSTD